MCPGNNYVDIKVKSQITLYIPESDINSPLTDITDADLFKLSRTFSYTDILENDVPCFLRTIIVGYSHGWTEMQD